MWATILLLDGPDNPWWDDTRTDDVTETRDDIVIRSFEQGYASTSSALGDNRDEWKWGDLHTSTFISNPLGASGIGLIEDTVNRGPARTSGGAAILNATRWSYDEDTPFSVRTVPSMRMVIDFSNFGNNVTVHTTGQSGHPASPQYGDFIDDWRNIDYHPMLWLREDIEANAASTLILKPSN